MTTSCGNYGWLWMLVVWGNAGQEIRLPFDMSMSYIGVTKSASNDPFLFSSFWCPKRRCLSWRVHQGRGNHGFRMRGGMGTSGLMWTDIRTRRLTSSAVTFSFRTPYWEVAPSRVHYMLLGMRSLRLVLSSWWNDADRYDFVERAHG